MDPYATKITLVGEGTKAGEASRIKLARNVFMKELEALVVESLLFARRLGIEDNILDSITGTMDKESFRAIATRLAGADLVHGERRAFEVGEAMELMEQVGVKPLVSAGVKARLSETASLGLNKELGGVAPKKLEDVYAAWERKNYN